MTKSPKALARLALRVAEKSLPSQSSKHSPKTFTQAQIFAILVLKAFFRTDYRGIVDLLEDWKDLQDELGLKKVPHFSTLWHAEQKLLKKRLLTYSKELSFDEQGNPDFFEAVDGPLSMRRG
jgi:hypothetical protein